MARVCSEETKEKMREKALFRFANKENHPMFNKRHSEETIKRMSISASKRIGEDNGMFGKHHSKETIEKISQTRIKNGKSKGTNNSMYGKKHTIKSRKRMSIKLKERFKDKTKHPMWNPDLTDEDRQDQRNYSEYREWRAAIYERDNYTCQVCGDNKGGNLVAHHLESYRDNPELRITLSNGITLCETCHDNFHHLFGFGHNTKEQFKEFINYG